jgi:hypothetical protein
MSSLEELLQEAAKAERDLIIACNALYLATDPRVADDMKAKAVAVLDTNAAFNKALASTLRPIIPPHDGSMDDE